MNSEVLVSIQCLVYNHAPYLRKCLDGFVMQIANFKFEAIVHDDASTDDSAQIIAEYADKYPEIIKPIYETQNQYFNEDGSLVRTMYKACSGKYIAFCEGDDFWIDPYKLQKQVEFLESHPNFVLCCHRYDKLYHEENIIKNDGLSVFITENSKGKEFGFEHIDIPLTLTVMITRDSLMEFVDYGSKYKRDYIMWYFVLRHGKGYCINEVMGVYRINQGGICGKQPLLSRIQNEYCGYKDLTKRFPNERYPKKQYYSKYATLFILTKGKIMFCEEFNFRKFISLPYFFLLKLLNLINR